MSKIDVTQVIEQLDGTPFKDSIGLCRTCGRPLEDYGDLTLRTVCINALAGRAQGDGLDGRAMVKRYDMALEIQHEDVVDLTNRDAGLIQELIAKTGYNPFIVAQAWRMLEG